jgi:outer membrane protein assembly factor BamB
MHTTGRLFGVLVGGVVLIGSAVAEAQDWPQWRGPNRDGKATGFQAPATWPQELKRNWSVTVGEGVSTPALVGDRLYVFARDDGNEITRCLAADTGDEVWQNKYAAQDADGAAARFPVAGPRSSPAVAEGKIVTLGTRGVLSCLDAETGALVWRKDDFKNNYPRFFVSSSPIILHSLVIAQLGGQGNGGLVAYDLASGDQRWSWTDDSPAYSSPVVTTVGDRRVIVFVSDKSLAAVGAADGKTLWKTSYEQGRYNATTPVVDGQTVIYAGPGRGTTAVSLQPEAAALSVKELWSNADNSLMYNSPVLRDGLLFGLSNSDQLFCVNLENGRTAWTVSSSGEPVAAAGNREQPRAQPGQGQGRRRRGGGGGGGGYGTITDVGSALLALTPNGQLTVYAPDAGSFQKLASYKVAEGGTYAYPIASGNRIYVKNQNSVTLWTMD